MIDLTFNRRVRATQDELDEWARTHPNRRRPSVHRVRCDWCDKRYWGSGLGVGSHRRGCPVFKLEGDEFTAAKNRAAFRYLDRKNRKEIAR